MFGKLMLINEQPLTLHIESFLFKLKNLNLVQIEELHTNPYSNSNAFPASQYEVVQVLVQMRFRMQLS